MEKVKGYKALNGEIYATPERAVAADLMHVMDQLTCDDNMLDRVAALYMADNHQRFIEILRQLDQDQ